MENKLQHIGIIMDGNRRWARKRGMPTFAGHKAGVDSLKKVAKAAINNNIPYITIYAFSTENWKRAQDEVKYLMKLIKNSIAKGTEFFNTNNIKIRIFGDLDNMVEPSLADALRAVEKGTASNTAVQCNVCFNYGGRDEIVNAVRKLVDKKIPADEVTADAISKELYSVGVPDPDIIVRTSGEQRLSNFLLWQSAYSELYFVDTLWPDFDEEALVDVIEEYGRRQRRFGQ
ncbi:MAG: polyprenyl diphosphate synthase [Patescibacteria group bacterium]